MTDQPVTVEDGKIFWRGTYKDRDEAKRLAAQFEAASDYFAPVARAYARQLRDALRRTEPMEQAA